jgi:hypothetical protein
MPFQLLTLLSLLGELTAHLMMLLEANTSARALAIFSVLTSLKILRKETMMRLFNSSSKSFKSLQIRAMCSNGET